MSSVTNTRYAPGLSLNDDPVWHLVRRATFTPTPALVSQVRREGIEPWLNRQLNPESINDYLYERERLRWFPDYYTSENEWAKKFPNQFSISHASYLLYMRRALLHERWSTRRQLQATVFGFWFDHFTVQASKTNAGYTTFFDVLRRNGLGTFENLLKGVMKTRVMHQYLDNHTNTGAAPNENLARELLELHTLGVSGGYTQEDVRQVARLISGAQLQVGTIVYNPSRHDRNPVKVMNWSHPNDGTTSEAISAQVDSLLSYLALHPSTARYISTKLVARFVSDNPKPTLVDRLTQIYLANDSELKPVLKALFLSQEFKNSIGEKVKRPQEQYSALMALSGARISPSCAKWPSANANIHEWNHLVASGHAPGEWIFPDGYPTEGDYWLSTAGLSASFKLLSTAVYLASASNYLSYYTRVNWNTRCGITKETNYLTGVKKLLMQLTGQPAPSTAFILQIANVWAGVTANGQQVKLNLPVNMNRTSNAVHAILCSPLFLVN